MCLQQKHKEVGSHPRKRSPSLATQIRKSRRPAPIELGARHAVGVHLVTHHASSICSIWCFSSFWTTFMRLRAFVTSALRLKGESIPCRISVWPDPGTLLPARPCGATGTRWSGAWLGAPGLHRVSWGGLRRFLSCYGWRRPCHLQSMRPFRALAGAAASCLVKWPTANPHQAGDLGEQGLARGRAILSQWKGWNNGLQNATGLAHTKRAHRHGVRPERPGTAQAPQELKRNWGHRVCGLPGSSPLRLLGR